MKTKRFYIAVFILIISLLTFSKIITQGLFPYPGDLLVSFNFPWYSGGWEGYDPWATHKEFIGADSIRQHIPWHNLTFDSLKSQFSIPLWNPYNFSGSPHFANPQTFILNPTNVLFIILPLFEAWIIFIAIQIPLVMFFTYIFCRSLKLGNISSVFSAIAFVFSSYFLIWVEIGIVGYSILWFPLILFGLKNLLETKKLRFLILLIFASSACIFAGHIQTAVFIFLVSLFFGLYLISSQKDKIFGLSVIILWVVFTLLITAIQTFPTLELYRNSPLTEKLSSKVFDDNPVPIKNYLALFANDLFGNPASKNLWTTLYGDGTPHIGVLPFFFSVFALIKLRSREVKFFAILVLVFVLYSIRSPLYSLIQFLNIPFLTATTPARSLFVLCFSLAVLAGFGLDYFLKTWRKKDKKLNILLILFFLTYLMFIASTFLIPEFSSDQNLWQEKLNVTRRNLVLPFNIFLLFSLFTLAAKFYKKNNTQLKYLLIIAIFSTTIFSGLYQLNKLNPFSSKKYFFPNHKVIYWLQDNGSINRFTGTDTAYIWPNFATFYKIYAPEGYGVFRIKRYAQLVESRNDGYVPVNYERALAEFDLENTDRQKRLFNLMGVKYILAKDDFAKDASKSAEDPNPPRDNVNLAWQDGKFKIYTRSESLPRFWLTADFIVAQSDQQVLDKIYDKNFDLKTIILEKQPSLKIENGDISRISLAKYETDNIEFTLQATSNQLFFISDTYYPGWKAYTDGQEQKIHRADYAFRAVEIPSGTKRLILKFEPITVKIGAITSALGIVTTIIVIAFLLRRKRFEF